MKPTTTVRAPGWRPTPLTVIYDDALTELAAKIGPALDDAREEPKKKVGRPRQNGPRVKWKPLADELRALMKTGLSIPQAAGKLGMSESRARAILAEVFEP